jgi:hypothetical protein
MSTVTMPCGRCDAGLVPVSGCNCDGDSDAYPGVHREWCGFEPCPNGCWDRLHPSADVDTTCPTCGSNGCPDCQDDDEETGR